MSKSLFIATPMYAGQCYGGYTLSMVKLVSLAKDINLTMDVSFVGNESLITRARNTLVLNFLEGNHTHLMFIDSDISFNAHDVVALLNLDLDIVCGLYPVKKLGEKQYAAKTLDNDKHLSFKTPTEPTELAASGTGFMMIKREVFEALKPKLPTYVLYERETTEFFTTSIDENKELLSEDYHFCKIARGNGFRVWAVPAIQLIHTGTCEY